MIKLFWSLFFPSGFTRFLNFQPKTNRALPAFFFWITVATPWLQFREFRDLESQRAWVYFETYNENLTFSYSFLSDLCVFGFNSQSKRGRELGSHPDWSEMDDSNFAQISETCFNQHSSWMYAGSESCHYQELSSTGSTVIPRWDLPSLQLYNRVFTGLIGHPVSQRDNKADLLALKMPSVQFCAFKTQVRLSFLGAVLNRSSETALVMLCSVRNTILQDDRELFSFSPTFNRQEKAFPQRRDSHYCV